MTSKANIIKHITAEYGASDFSMLNLNDPELMSKILSQGDRIAIHAKKGLVNIDHADVIRKIEYFKSGKVKVSLRIGTFDLKTLYSNDIIYFRVPNSFQIQQHFLNSQQQLKNSFYHFK